VGVVGELDELGVTLFSINIHKKIESFLIIIERIIIKTIMSTTSTTSNTEILLNAAVSNISDASDSPVVQSVIKKIKRSKEEIALEKAEKAQKKLEKDMKKKENTSPLITGTGLDARAAMIVFAAAATTFGAALTNNAFRRMIVSRILFPPKKNINKFMTGGVAEECTNQLMNSLGFHSINTSDETTVTDLEITVPIPLPVPLIDSLEEKLNHCFKVSVKNSSDIKSQPILENYRSNKHVEIRDLPPTFIVYTEMKIRRVRIVYIDHEIIKQGYPHLTEEQLNEEVYKNDDSNLTFSSGFLSKFIPRLPKEYILDAEYPEVPDLIEQNIVKLALAEVDRQLASCVL